MTTLPETNENQALTESDCRIISALAGTNENHGKTVAQILTRAEVSQVTFYRALNKKHLQIKKTNTNGKTQAYYVDNPQEVLEQASQAAQFKDENKQAQTKLDKEFQRLNLKLDLLMNAQTQNLKRAKPKQNQTQTKNPNPSGPVGDSMIIAFKQFCIDKGHQEYLDEWQDKFDKITWKSDPMELAEELEKRASSKEGVPILATALLLIKQQLLQHEQRKSQPGWEPKPQQTKAGNQNN